MSLTPPCTHTQADSDSITLSNVPFAATNGSFTINLWMRRPGNANLTGTQYQYLFSQASTPSSLVAQPNSVSSRRAGLAGLVFLGVILLSIEHLYSRLQTHALATPEPLPILPNPQPPPPQIGIYLPDSEHPASGLVRVMVVDGTGDPTGNSANYLDSDGHVNDNEARNTSSPAQSASWGPGLGGKYLGSGSCPGRCKGV